MIKELETIYNKGVLIIERTPTPTGWLVITYAISNQLHEDGHCNSEHFRVSTTSVPDPNHEWEI